MIVLILAMILLLWSKLKPTQEIVFWSIFMSLTFVVSFFFGLNPIVSALIFFAGCGIRVWLSERKWNTESSFAMLISLPFLLTASMPTCFLDAGTYYEQSARWFEQGIPQGLGNFDIYLMQSSMAHSNEALLSSLLSAGQNDLSVLIGTFLIAVAFSRLKQMNWAIFSVALIVFGILSHFTQASSTDFLMIAFVIYYYLGRNSEERKVSELIALIVILPFIKPVGAGISLLLAVELWQRSMFKYWWILVLAGFAFVAKNFWVSGWLPVLGKMPVSFAIPKEAIEFLKFSQTFYDYEGRDNLSFNVDLLFGALYLALIIFQARLTKLKSKLLVAQFLIQLIILIFWSINNPAGRYLIPFFLIILINTPIEKPFLNMQRSWVMALLCGIGLFSVLPMWSNVLPGARAQRMLAFGGVENVHWLTPAPLWEPKTKPIALENDFKVNIPIEQYLCFDAAFPCNAKLARYYNGDSVYLPVFNAGNYSFFYKSVLGKGEGQALLDSLSTLPQFPIKSSH